MRSVSALGVVAILFALALLQPWSVLSAGERDLAAPETRAAAGARLGQSAASELEEARRCSRLVRSAGQQARPLRGRICERRGGVEMRLGQVRELSRR